MDRPPNPDEEATESVNPTDQGFPASDPSDLPEVRVMSQPNQMKLC